MLALALFALAAQTCPQPVALNAGGTPNSSEVASEAFDPASGFVTDGSGIVYFAANRELIGRELFRSDGTEAGTLLVKDIALGVNGSDPTQLIGAPGRIYFLADDGVSGRELWTSDGSAAGTVRLLNSVPGPGVGDYGDFGVLGGSLLFSATSAAGAELFISNGTVSGTRLLADLNPGGDSNPGEFALAPNGTELYFRAQSAPGAGFGLWKTDGTLTGTQLVNSLNGSLAGNTIQDFVNAGGLTYFDAISMPQTNNHELWVTDGTTAGTKQLATLFGNTSFSKLILEDAVVFGERLVFAAREDFTGDEVWASDGTVAGTGPFIDIAPGFFSSTPRHFALLGSELIFTAELPGTGRELWRADLAGNANLIVDLIPGAGSGFDLFDPPRFVEFGGQLCFPFDDGVNSAIWATDGTAAGTVKSVDVQPGVDSDPLDLTALSSSAFLFAAESTTLGRELWRYDAGLGATLLEVDSGTPGVASTVVSPNSIANQRLFLGATGIGQGTEPYRWTPQDGFVPLGDLNPGTFGSDPKDFTRLWTGSKELILFSAFGPYGLEVYVTNGTQAGTHLLKDINPGTKYSPFFESALFTPIGNRMLFRAYDSILGVQVWVTDGTEQGTVALGTQIPKGSLPYPTDFVRFGDKIAFAMQGEPAIWLTDGTPAGTHPMWSQTDKTKTGEYPSDLYVDGNRLYYAAESSIGGYDNGRENFMTFGTYEGTWMIGDLNQSKSDTDPSDFIKVGDKILFAGTVHSDGTTDPGVRVLCSTTGAWLSTQIVKDVDGLDPHDPVLMDGVAYFISGPNGNRGLLRSDGTEQGTYYIYGGQPGPGKSVAELTVVNNQLFFAGQDIQFGTELFVSDGTVNGTRVLCDINPGPNSSYPKSLKVINGQLVMTAVGANGVQQLYSMPLPGAYVSDLGAGLDVTLSATTPELGSTLTLSAKGIGANELSAYYWSLPVKKPSAQLVLPGYALWLDLVTASFVQGFAGGNWTATLPLPNIPALAGFVVNVQAIVLPNGSLPLKTSNGLGMTLGY